MECFDDAQYLDSVAIALQTVENKGLGIVESVSIFVSMMLNIMVLTAIVSTVNPFLVIMSVCMALLTYDSRNKNIWG